MFYAKYPASGSNPSVGVNGVTAPLSSTEIGGVDGSGNLVPVSVDSSGNVNANVVSAVLPTGAATAANQVIEIADLDAISTSTAAINSKTVAVDTGNVTVVSSSLPTGAATEATLAALSNKTAAGLVPEAFDSMDITYVIAGNGIGEIATVTYKLGVSTVAVLTLSYNASNKLTNVTKA